MTATATFLKTFFEEKNLPEVTFEVDSPNGTPNFIPNNVVIEHILAAGPYEQQQIANILRKIDFANGDVNHFLKHLAGALARDL